MGKEGDKKKNKTKRLARGHQEGWMYKLNWYVLELFFICMMLQKVFKTCMHRLRNDNLKGTHSLSKLEYAVLPGHQMALFYVFTMYRHGFNISFTMMFLNLTRDWLCQLFLLVAPPQLDLR